MVNKNDPTYTQYITTSNSYLTASTFYGQLKIIVAYCLLFVRNNFSTLDIRRSIFNISMVNKNDPTYTQYITTSNSYLNPIYILRPIENYRRVTARYL